MISNMLHNQIYLQHSLPKTGQGEQKIHNRLQTFVFCQGEEQSRAGMRGEGEGRYAPGTCGGIRTRGGGPGVWPAGDAARFRPPGGATYAIFLCPVDP